MKNWKNKKGFTLIEVIITTLIIGIFVNIFYMEKRQFFKYDNFFIKKSKKNVDYSTIIYNNDNREKIKLTID